MTSAADLKKDFVLIFELNFFVVDPARQIHRPVDLQHLFAGQINALSFYPWRFRCARRVGRSIAARFAPGWLATGGAGVLEAGARLFARRPPVCREMVRVLRAGHVYDGSRATRDLGLAYTPLETTIERTVDWFRNKGLLI